MFFSSLSSVNSLKCTSMSNYDCKVRREIINVNNKEQYFILIVLKQANVVVVAIMLMTPTQNHVFLMLLKI